MISFTAKKNRYNMEVYLGFLAAFCTTIAFIPQAVKVYKTKHTKDISLSMFVLMMLGMVLWLWYGLVIISYPIIITNTITIVLAAYILISKIRFDTTPTKMDEKIIVK